MRWTNEERAAFFELWGEEPVPKGWRLLRERLAQAIGEDRFIKPVSRLITGGDPVISTLALRAHAKKNPQSKALWVPSRYWSDVPSVWMCSQETVIRLAQMLDVDATKGLNSILEDQRKQAMTQLEEHGGSWFVSKGRIRHCFVKDKIMFSLLPSGIASLPIEPQTPWEKEMLSLHARAMLTGSPFSPKQKAMIGGRADVVWVLSMDPTERKVKKNGNRVDFSLPIYSDASIFDAQAMWWDTVKRLIEAHPLP